MRKIKRHLNSRSLACAVLALALIIALPISQAYAAATVVGAYGTNSTKVKDAFASAMGWDESKLQSTTWTGVDGNEYKTLTVGYQNEYYADMLSILAKEMGITLTAEEGEGSVSGGSAASIVAVALAEVGETEQPPGSNHIKYTEWYGMGDVAWCAIFISWCANECGLINEDGSGLFKKIAWCDGYYDHFVNDCGFESYAGREITQLGGGSYTAVPGDIFLFLNTGGSDGHYGHIGLVTGVGDGWIEITQGNTSDSVMRITYGPEAAMGDYVGSGAIIHVEYPESDQSIFLYLTKSLGLTPAAACGVLANLDAESGLCPARVQGDFSPDYSVSYAYAAAVDAGTISREDFIYNGPGGGGFGLAQWTYSTRKAALYDLHISMGMSIYSYDVQLTMLSNELQADASILAQLQALGNTEEDVRTAATIWCTQFERPDNMWSAAVYRGNLGVSNFWPIYSNSSY